MAQTFSSPEDENFFGAIGRLTLAWGHLELGLDCTIHILHHAFGGNKQAKDIPRALNRKLRYLRNWVKQTLPDQEAVTGYLSFLDAIEKSSQTRHDIIHGAVVEHMEGSGEANFKRLLRNSDTVQFREFTMTTEGILQAAIDAQRLGGKALWWSNELQKFVS